MGAFQIRFYEFALCVSRDTGMTVIFPAVNHVLMIDTNPVAGRRTFPILRGSTIEIQKADGSALDARAPGRITFDDYVVDISEAEGRTIDVPPVLLDAATPQDPTLINARVRLAEGHIIGCICSNPAYANEPWQFTATKHRVTDTVVYEHDVDAGEHYQLVINGRGDHGGQPHSFPLSAGDQITLRNEDALGGPSGSFAELKEYDRLLEVVREHSGRTPVYTGPTTRGWETVCAVVGVHA